MLLDAVEESIRVLEPSKAVIAREQSLLLYFRRDIPRALQELQRIEARCAPTESRITVGCRYRLQGAFDGAAGNARAVGAFDLWRRSD
jgi:hypothetical protein